MEQLSPRILSFPACGGGWEGVSGGAALQGPSRRGTLSRPLPQAGGGKVERLPLGGRKMMERSPRFFSSPACGGGRVGVREGLNKLIQL